MTITYISFPMDCLYVKPYFYSVCCRSLGSSAIADSIILLFALSLDIDIGACFSCSNAMSLSFSILLIYLVLCSLTKFLVYFISTPLNCSIAFSGLTLSYDCQ